LEIAKTLNVPELTAFLEEKGYKIEEVDAMAKSSLRKINERYGKNNEIIDGRIAGVMQSKVQIDVKAIEAQKAEYEAELEQVRSKFNNLMQADKETEGKIAELEGKCIEIERSEQQKLDDKIASASEKLRKQEQIRNDAEIEEINKRHESQRLFADKEGVEDSLENYRNLYKKVQDEVFDESSLKCPVCGRKYSADKAEKMKKTFEDSKTKRLNDYKSRGETFSKQLDKIQEKYEKAHEEYEKAHMEWHKADSKAQDLAEKLMSIPRRANMAECEEYQNIRNEIKSLQSTLAKKDDLKLQELSNRESYLISMIKQAIAEIAVSERNKDLDVQISALRTEKKDAEVQRAENEKLINQVKIFTQAKNDLLTSKINEKFSMVDWHLWEYQKNGDIKPVCEPYIDGKPMTSAANGSLITLAKISICADLQKHFGQIMPIWVEDYSLFSSNTESRLNVDSQIIGLVVTEDKELQIERG
jgi:chromosome segregation ATPase